MALTGVHVTCIYVFTLGGVGLPATAAWSETLNSAGATTNSARQPSSMPSRGDGFLCLEVSAAVDAYVAVGSAPDASQAIGSAGNSARYLVRGGDTRNIVCGGGEKLAWIAA